MKFCPSSHLARKHTSSINEGRLRDSLEGSHDIVSHGLNQRLPALSAVAQSMFQQAAQLIDNVIIILREGKEQSNSL